ncbi:hypothetical protein FB567DRAFT_519502 [Paraphoma chrysanthemicola]|uniref:Uncharacterized protein n=1 Tax=Paraphoma chrysanthemicola TaxID=798071 RepID=A0A8K0R8N3_9PLEO|nr:hypothetical protein FB567DRAFT_519502 [Paraphoma chrysanthemicola]
MILTATTGNELVVVLLFTVKSGSLPPYEWVHVVALALCALWDGNYNPKGLPTSLLNHTTLLSPLTTHQLLSSPRASATTARCLVRLTSRFTSASLPHNSDNIGGQSTNNCGNHGKVSLPSIFRIYEVVLLLLRRQNT